MNNELTDKVVTRNTWLWQQYGSWREECDRQGLERNYTTMKCGPKRKEEEAGD
jgi:hypothetical protein